MLLTFLALLSFFCAISWCQDSCHHVEKNLTGICRLATECPMAFLEDEVQFCNVASDLVCCAKGDFGTASAKKCAEYTGACAVKPEVGDKKKVLNGDFPHMALLKGDGVTCVGSLISERFILTEGFCLNRKLAVIKYAVLGDIRLKSDSADVYKVEKMYRFPLADLSKGYHDIGLLRLDRDVKFSELVRPICLHDGSKLGKRGVVVGWGRIDKEIELSDTLEKMTVTLNEVEVCRVQSDFLDRGVLDELHVCASANASTCASLGGSPLQVQGRCGYTLVAVMGFQFKSGCRDSPLVMTKVAPYIGWIEKLVWPELA